jgi:hypothetical protein
MGDYVKKSMSPGVNRDRKDPEGLLRSNHPAIFLVSGKSL